MCFIIKYLSNYQVKPISQNQEHFWGDVRVVEKSVSCYWNFLVVSAFAPEVSELCLWVVLGVKLAQGLATIFAVNCSWKQVL